MGRSEEGRVFEAVCVGVPHGTCALYVVHREVRSRPGAF